MTYILLQIVVAEQPKCPPHTSRDVGSTLGKAKVLFFSIRVKIEALTCDKKLNPKIKRKPAIFIMCKSEYI